MVNLYELAARYLIFVLVVCLSGCSAAERYKFRRDLDIANCAQNQSISTLPAASYEQAIAGCKFTVAWERFNKLELKAPEPELAPKPVKLSTDVCWALAGNLYAEHVYHLPKIDDVLKTDRRRKDVVIAERNSKYGVFFKDNFDDYKTDDLILVQNLISGDAFNVTSGAYCSTESLSRLEKRIGKEIQRRAYHAASH